jgi:hypothetical protein
MTDTSMVPQKRDGDPPPRGAGERSRTADLPFTRRLLCLLSYTGGELPAC